MLEGDTHWEEDDVDAAVLIMGVVSSHVLASIFYHFVGGSEQEQRCGDATNLERVFFIFVVSVFDYLFHVLECASEVALGIASEHHLKKLSAFRHCGFVVLVFRHFC